jgi:ATP-dependent exoDNAse (exonuclease V) alpha subunit
MIYQDRLRTAASVRKALSPQNGRYFAHITDVNLARDLFSALGPTTRLVLIGDPDQLPSIGAVRTTIAFFGAVFGVKTISLTRQARDNHQETLNKEAMLLFAGKRAL